MKTWFRVAFKNAFNLMELRNVVTNPYLLSNKHWPPLGQLSSQLFEDRTTPVFPVESLQTWSLIPSASQSLNSYVLPPWVHQSPSFGLSQPNHNEWIIIRVEPWQVSYEVSIVKVIRRIEYLLTLRFNSFNQLKSNKKK